MDDTGQDARTVPVGQARQDPFDARQRLQALVADSALTALLRRDAHAIDDGTDWSRCDDHQVLDQLAAAVADRRVRGAATRPALLRLVPVPAPASPSSPAPSGAPRAAAPAAAPSPSDGTFADLDIEAMVATLQRAARDGMPFCEECARAAAGEAAA